MWRTKNACNHEFGVALDVGHTPERPGTLTARGRTEYEFNLHLAESIRSVLIQRGYKNVYVIKIIGGSETLPQRDIKANDLNANLFISLHHNSVKSSYLKTWMVDGKQLQYNDDFSGYSLFVTKKNPNWKHALLSPPCCPTSCWPAISILRFTMRPRKSANCWTKIAGYIGTMTLSF